ncbi:hypothetical protein CDAR_607911 [Caerostris darwini]|uniref:Uncharacterized protein n=1 Tax=Caerostris darwini TaxID=1538125 RepID=A0AAV4ULB4_9ARAC|nr:hypothetical protein CDAR_607911 [Caerostris darwini]
MNRFVKSNLPQSCDGSETGTPFNFNLKKTKKFSKNCVKQNDSVVPPEVVFKKADDSGIEKELTTRGRCWKPDPIVRPHEHPRRRVPYHDDQGRRVDEGVGWMLDKKG